MVDIKIPDSLKQALQSRQLVPFIGSGLSMSVLNKDTGKALFPSWPQLLLKAADKLMAENKPKPANRIRANIDYPGTKPLNLMAIPA